MTIVREVCLRHTLIDWPGTALYHQVLTLKPTIIIAIGVFLNSLRIDTCVGQFVVTFNVTGKHSFTFFINF